MDKTYISEETWKKIGNEHLNEKMPIIKLAKKYNMRYGTIYYGLKRRGVNPVTYKTDKRKFYVDDKFFDVIDNSDKAYILGLLLCDGSAEKRKNPNKTNRFSLRLQKKDGYLVEAIKNMIAPEYKILEDSGVKNGKRYFRTGLEINSNKIVNRLHELGMVQDKFLRTLPSVPEEFKGDLIRGIFDADGSISKTKRKGVANSHQVYIAQSNKKLIEQLHDYIGFGNVYINSRKHLNQRDMIYIRFNAVSEKLNLYYLMYENANLFLKRKYDIYTKYVNTVLNAESKKSASV